MEEVRRSSGGVAGLTRLAVWDEDWGEWCSDVDVRTTVAAVGGDNKLPEAEVGCVTDDWDTAVGGGSVAPWWVKGMPPSSGGGGWEAGEGCVPDGWHIVRADGDEGGGTGCRGAGGGAVDIVGPVCDVAEDGEVGGEANNWLGECISGKPIKIGGFPPSGGGRGTEVILANNDWKEVAAGEYMEAMPGGSIWGGALCNDRRLLSRN